jgi:MFS family permease
MVSDLVGKELRGTGYGLYHAALGITLLPASLIAGILYDKVDADAPFYLGSVMAFIAAILMVIFLFENKVRSKTSEKK